MITFDVSSVSASRTRLPSAGTAAGVAARLVHGAVEAAASNLPNLVLSLVRREEYEPEENEDGDLVGVLVKVVDIPVEVEGNPFVGAVHVAFAEHRPLILSPDDVWLCIAQGFGLHVNENAEQLRGRFVHHQGREIIRVVRNEFVKGSSENDWTGVFTEFSDQIANHIGKQRDLVVAAFSTTGPIERAVSEIVLMSAMQRYFDYELQSLCGIPSITLLGTTDDWRSIRARAAVLAEYDLGWWAEALLPVLDQFVAASDGHVDREFWQSIYKVRDESGGPYISGWIGVFFPYVMHSSELVSNRRYIERWKGSFEEDSSDEALISDMLPNGMSGAPFIWEYLGTDIAMEFLGGFVGVSQDLETQAVRPAIGWAVRDASVKVMRTPSTSR
jgi:hypothetical protein